MKDYPQFYLDENLNVEEAIAEYAKKKAILDKAIKDIKFDFPDHDINGHYFDRRDLIEILSFMPIVGKNEEEQIQSIQNNFKDMAHAFVANDTDSIGVYLEFLYSNYDKLDDYYKNGIKTKEDFANYQFLFAADQSMTTKRIEYPEIFYKHYNNDEKLAKYTTRSFLSPVMLTDIARLKRDYPGLPNKSGMPFDFADEAERDRRTLGDAMFDAGQAKSNIVEFRDTARYLPSVDADLKKVRDPDYFRTFIFDQNFINDIVTHELNAGSERMNVNNLTFIDGKPLYDEAKKFIEKNYSDKKGKDKEDLIERQCTKMYQSALARGDHAIAFAIPKTVNGKVDFKLMKVKPNVEPQAQEERAKHSKFRLKYFNWGPFKVLPDQKYTNELVASTKNDEAILEQASKIFNAFVEEGKKTVAPPNEEAEAYLKQEAREYLLKEENLDLQNDTSLEKANAELSAPVNPPEKTVNKELNKD